MSTTIEQPLLRLQEPKTSDNLAEKYDRRLVDNAKAGDADAFARLYAAYAERVLGYMYFQVQDEQAAHGLAARVFNTAWESLRCYEQDKLPFSIWLYMIARQTVIDFRQRRDGSREVTEILSPTDKGLEEYEPFRPCGNE